MIQNDMNEMFRCLALNLLLQVERFKESKLSSDELKRKYQVAPEDSLNATPYVQALKGVSQLEASCNGNYTKVLALAHEEFCKHGLILSYEPTV